MIHTGSATAVIAGGAGGKAAWFAALGVAGVLFLGGGGAAAATPAADGPSGTTPAVSFASAGINDTPGMIGDTSDSRERHDRRQEQRQLLEQQHEQLLDRREAPMQDTVLPGQAADGGAGAV